MKYYPNARLPDWLCFSVIGIKNFVWLFGFFLTAECKRAKNSGEKLRNHRQIFNEDLFFRDHHDFGAKVEKSLTDFK